MKFVDEVVVHAKAGDGGNGTVAWRREIYVPRGGPAGGDGGDGGNVVFKADSGKHSLLDFHFQPLIKGQNGEKGGTSDRHGKSGDDVVIQVPVGTQIFDNDSGELLADLTAKDEEAIVCKGGLGGLGNARFTTSTRQAPTFAKPGEPGEERMIKLSLKLMADVGLVGLPNAGKSTLLSRLTAARPKIADYPFTTLTPMLGVVRVREEHSFVIADIPGLIEGASDGVGLGTKFLKHIERVRAICHLIEPDLEENSSLLDKYQIIRTELGKFSSLLESKPEIVVVSKNDILAEHNMNQIEELRLFLASRNIPLYMISSVTGNGLDELQDTLFNLVKQPDTTERISKFQ